MKAIKISVYGKVHGVYFRANTCQKAKSLKINGTVKNMADGSVQIIAEGDENNIEHFVKWCHEGPLLAKVGSIKIFEMKLEGFSNFEIIY